jgi:hypothetical protein
MTPLGVSQVGARLDEHHLPETNGSVAICRRCGARTDGPIGDHHLPGDRQDARYDRWLGVQAGTRAIDR